MSGSLILAQCYLYVGALFSSNLNHSACASASQDYFSEASLCQDEMDQVMELSDKLLNTLDANDTETLHQSIASVNKRLAHVLAASQKKQQLLETKTSQWHTFQVWKHSQVCFCSFTWTQNLVWFCVCSCFSAHTQMHVYACADSCMMTSGVFFKFVLLI